MSPRQLLCAAVLMTVAPSVTLAARSAIQPGSCPAESFGDSSLTAPASSFGPKDAEDGLVHAVADYAEGQMGESLLLRGHIEFLHRDIRLFADEAEYNQRNNSVLTRGHSILQKDNGDVLASPSFRYEIDTDHAQGESPEFSLRKPQARGRAKRVYLDGRNVMGFETVRFTTCPLGQDDWFLRARRLSLDHATETATGTNVVVELLHVPIFYTPYLSFPLTSERRSGFLSPRLGDNNKSGFFVAAPYYFNLAPNYDDTLTPRYMSRRGLQVADEFRYLGENLKGSVIAEYLPNDRIAAMDRERLAVNHNQQLSPYWTTSAGIEWVSDNNYFIDLGSTAAAAETARTTLPHSLRFDYNGSVWHFLARLSTFQTIDSTITLADQPYQRLPQLVLTGDSPGGPNALHYSFYGEWANFYRQSFTDPVNPANNINSAYGQRLDVLPSVSLPLKTSYFYLIPKVGYRYTTWRLQNTENGMDVGTYHIVIDDNTPERSLPIYSVDTGLILERDSTWGKDRYTQTLEPRIFYVRVPYRDQDNLPVFDTAIPDFSFFNFFRENRFVGADRVGDTNQMTAAITSRFLSQTNGAEMARVSLGQVRYFDDQRVNWPPNPGSVTPTSSDLIGEVFARLGQPWYLRSAIEWDNKTGEMPKASLYVHYRPEADRIVNIGYRLLDMPSTPPRDQQFDVSAQWPLTPHWTGLGRWNYSLEDQHTVLAYAGFEYSSCCWGARFTARRRILPDTSLDTTFLFEVVLSGLSSRHEQDQDSPLHPGKFLFE